MQDITSQIFKIQIQKIPPNILKKFKVKKKGSPRLKLVIHKLCLESI